MKLEPGMLLLGKYRIERVLGRGGMGVVLAAHHIHLDQPVAIKFLNQDVLADREAVIRFLREARSAVKLESEHVCKVLDVGSMDNGAPYMVMEYMDGVDLGELASREPLSPSVVADLMLQACAALAEAHALGIVHRDIKPANLFITTRPDGSQRLKVLDFGISKAPVILHSDLTSTQTVMGTPSYMSPEQMRSSKQVDARTDIWSLGVVLYELLAGRRPFDAPSFSEICLQIGVDDTPPIEFALPDGFDEIAYQCLEKDPDERFQNVAELATALAPYAANPVAAASIVDSTWATLGRANGRRASTADGAPPRISHSTLMSTLGSSAGQLRDNESKANRTRVASALISALALGVIAAALFYVVSIRGPDQPTSPNPAVEVHPTAHAPIQENRADASVRPAEPPVLVIPTDEDIFMHPGDQADEFPASDLADDPSADPEQADLVAQDLTEAAALEDDRAAREDPSRTPDHDSRAPDPSAAPDATNDKSSTRQTRRRKAASKDRREARRIKHFLDSQQ